MHFLKSPITWILLALGIWLNCEMNYKTMQYNGVDAVTTPMLFKQALIGSAVLVGICCVLALLRGEKWERELKEDYSGKGKVALAIIIGVVVVGFIVNGGLDYFDPPQR